MQLLMFITNKVEVIPAIISEFMEAGLPGTTVIDCEGALHALHQSAVEPPPIFGALRAFLHPGQDPHKILLSVISDTQADNAISIINNIVGDLSRPETGIVFTVPISRVEGLAKQK